MSPVILVTGASRGIGLAVTNILLNTLNARVIAVSRTTSPDLEQLKSDRLFIANADVADETAFANAINNGVGYFKALDGLILNAGTLDPLCRIGSNTPVSGWKKHFDVNFFSLVTAVQIALPHLRESKSGGRIVFVSSGAAVKGIPGWGPYNAGKAAMNSLCRTLAEEEPSVISVAVRPGMVNTAMQLALREGGAEHMDKVQHESFVDTYTQGKLVKPEECGHVIAALSLGAPKELNGQFVSWDSEECKAFRA